MAKKKGICQNDACPLCDQIQEADEMDFVCSDPSCHEPLLPFDDLDPHDSWERRKKWIIGGAAAILLGGGGAGGYFLMGGNSSAVEKIQISSPLETVSVGDEISLTVTTTPVDAKASYIWRSSNERVAAVTQQGDKATVKLKEQGEAYIYVQVKGQEALKDSCWVDVTGGAVLTNWISIMDGKTLSLKLGEQKTLSLDCDPGNANEGVNWTSSDNSVATVTKNGTVNAVGAGKATIKATTVVKQNTASIEVTVKSAGGGGGGTGGTATNMNLPYGTYSGESKNGKPHGMGKIVYTKEAVINSHDPKKRTAKPGESVQGQFVNGEIAIGRHFDANGNLIQALNFGVAP